MRGTPTWAAQGLTGDARSNWVWLVDVPQWDDLLMITDAPATEATAQGWFERCDTTTPAEVLAWPGGRGGASEPSAHTGATAARSFDCVFIDQLLSPCSLKDRALVTRSAGKLRVGGCLVTFVRNAVWYRSALRPCLREGARVPWSLRRLGFERVVSYYVIPTPERPTDLIPTTRYAVSSYYRIHNDGSRMELLRRLVTRLGLHRLAFAFQLKLAYR